MICNNCGKELEQGASFCSYCGTRAAQPQPVAEEKPVNTEAETRVEKAVEETTVQTPSTAAEEPISAPAPAAAPTTTAATAPNPAPAATPTPVRTKDYNGFSQPVPPPPPMPFVENRKPVKSPKAEKPKTFFGKGALALCLIIIGILSCSTTVFATLFFTLLGRM